MLIKIICGQMDIIPGRPDENYKKINSKVISKKIYNKEMYGDVIDKNKKCQHFVNKCWHFFLFFEAFSYCVKIKL